MNQPAFTTGFPTEDGTLFLNVARWATATRNDAGEGTSRNVVDVVDVVGDDGTMKSFSNDDAVEVWKAFKKVSFPLREGRRGNLDGILEITTLAGGGYRATWPSGFVMTFHHELEREAIGKWLVDRSRRLTPPKLNVAREPLPYGCTIQKIAGRDHFVFRDGVILCEYVYSMRLAGGRTTVHIKGPGAPLEFLPIDPSAPGIVTPADPA